MEFQQVYSKYHEKLHEVEELLQEAVKSRQSTMTEAALQLLHAGGKRIRPLFALICGQLGSNHDKKVQFVAAALELIHMATLVHDDVIDNASVRRGKTTIRAQYGNRTAMYIGDFLLARAIQLLSQVNHSEVHQEMSNAIVRMCEGEIEQLRDFYNWNQSLRVYLRRVERKTALLISVSCSLSATVAQASIFEISRLRRFGYYTGMAFQIVDDVLDFTSEQNIIGKPVAGDLRQGNLTLPTLWVGWHSKDAQEIRSLVHPKMTEAEAHRAIELVKESNALQESQNIAYQYLKKALHEIERMPTSEIQQELITVAQFVNERLF